MQLEEAKFKARGSIGDYLEVIKPRETGLLVFIGMITYFVAGGAVSSAQFWEVLIAIFLASAGANGLTNYLDRDLDARLERTRHRVLPSRKIYPPERALFFTAVLSAAGLTAAWFLHPLAFLAALTGTAAAIIYRKRVTCVFPQGMIASCAPVLMGWFAVNSYVNVQILLLCVLIAVWLPAHIWSVMLMHDEDYRKAGITYFPLNSSTRTVTSLLVAFCVLLYAASIGLYFFSHFGWLYLVSANLSGMMIIYASLRLRISSASGDAWKLYKLSAFPYLGVIFLAMGLSVWLKI
jgi:heme o synthase